jgi:hypothetical protein
MAKIDSLTFTITRTSSPAGHICRIDYGYYLAIDPQQYRHGDSFSVTAELHGDDIIYDQTLGEPVYDPHIVDRSTSMPVDRHFIVPCEILDEALGTDKIYLKLFIKSSEGEILTVRSATVKDRF